MPLSPVFPKLSSSVQMARSFISKVLATTIFPPPGARRDIILESVARLTQGLYVVGLISAPCAKGADMVKGEVCPFLARRTPKLPGVNQGEPVEGKQASLTPRRPCPAVVPSYEPASLVDAPLATEPKRLRLSAPPVPVESSETNLTERPGKSEHGGTHRKES